MTDPMADEAFRLRTIEQLSIRQIQERLGIGKDRLRELLRDVPPPEWTKRPNAKDEKRAEAIQLRGAGWSVPEIALELGVAKSTAYQWVKHLPLPPETEQARRRAHSKHMTDTRWAPHRKAREEARSAAHAQVAARIGRLDERDLLLIGAVLYWCEGAKSKPWRRNDHINLINSDVRLLALFLRFLETLGVDRSVPTYRLSIHENADVEAATAWWITALDLPAERFRRATLKRHQPKTVRHNTGADYHGCLVIDVPRSRELYWLIEGVMAGLTRPDDQSGGTDGQLPLG